MSPAAPRGESLESWKLGVLRSVRFGDQLPGFAQFRALRSIAPQNLTHLSPNDHGQVNDWQGATSGRRVRRLGARFLRPATLRGHLHPDPLRNIEIDLTNLTTRRQVMHLMILRAPDVLCA